MPRARTVVLCRVAAAMAACAVLAGGADAQELLATLSLDMPGLRPAEAQMAAAAAPQPAPAAADAAATIPPAGPTPPAPAASAPSQAQAPAQPPGQAQAPASQICQRRSSISLSHRSHSIPIRY